MEGIESFKEQIMMGCGLQTCGGLTILLEEINLTLVVAKILFVQDG